MRDAFHAELDALVDTLLSMGDTVIEMLDRSLTSLSRHDLELADRTIRTDNVVDTSYEDVQHSVIRIMALQAPVASDLRLISAMTHVNIHLERMGDYAATIAKMGKLSAGYRDEPELTDQLHEMGRIARRVARQALTSFAHRDVAAAWQLSAVDAQVNQLNIGMFHRLVRLAAEDESRLEWATHMILVARQIERWSDHAVDIGESTIFVVTGQTVELSSNAPDARPAPAAS